MTNAYFTAPMKRLVLAELQTLANGGVKPASWLGLCSHLCRTLGITAAWVEARVDLYQLPDECLYPYFEAWPAGTGSRNYPVPARKNSKSVRLADKAFDDCDDKWNKRTAYGRLRWELVHWLIEQLTVELAQETSDDH